MKFYIAARFDNQEKVREIYKKLAEKGHEVHTDWTVHTPFYPYISDPAKCAQYADEDINGAMNCDAFVLLADEQVRTDAKGAHTQYGQPEQKAKSHGRGMFIELGAAMATFLQKGTPKVFVIGPDNDKAIFHFHHSITRLETIDQVLENLELKADMKI